MNNTLSITTSANTLTSTGVSGIGNTFYGVSTIPAIHYGGVDLSKSFIGWDSTIKEISMEDLKQLLSQQNMEIIDSCDISITSDLNPPRFTVVDNFYKNPDDEKQIEENDQIRNNSEVEFELVDIWENGNTIIHGIKYAKLI